MHVGMLWYDGEKEPAVGERIRRAAEYYRIKYGRAPNLCLANPAAGEEPLPPKVGEIEVRTSRSVLKQHLWIGVREDGRMAQAA